MIGIPHDKLGEDLLAVMTVAPGAQVDTDKIREFCADKLADFKIPRRFEIIAEMPRSPMGKILKTELRATYKNLVMAKAS